MRSLPDVRASVRTGPAAAGSPIAPPLLINGDADAGAQLDGFRAGRADGFAVGLEEGRNQGEATLATALQALQHLLHEVRERESIGFANLEELAVELAVELAETILQREVSDDSGQTVIARALSLRTGREPVKIHLHPEDAAAIGEIDSPDIEVVTDPTQPLGSALAELGEGSADISVDSAMARAREALA